MREGSSSSRVKDRLSRRDDDDCTISGHNRKSRHRKRNDRSSSSSSSSSDSSKSSSNRSRSSPSGDSGNERKKHRRTANTRNRETKPDANLLRGRIKQEPISDNESHHRGRRRNDNERSRGFQDRARTSRWNSSPSRESTVAVKRERGSDAEGGEPRWGRVSDERTGGKKPAVNNAKPDFGLSGKLAEETNMYNGVVIKYSEPVEARKPKRRWRLYPFKGEEGLPTLHIHRQSAFLLGRDRKVADIPVDHPSCSKQHAVLQYRLVPFENSDGRVGKRIRPYIIDLESANGTYVNNVRIEHKKYVELLEKDVIKFGFSSREYVLLHEHSKDSDEDDNM